jgi:pimeloyl-ACP methyl ester carboxylesterase
VSGAVSGATCQSRHAGPDVERDVVGARRRSGGVTAALALALAAALPACSGSPATEGASPGSAVTTAPSGGSPSSGPSSSSPGPSSSSPVPSASSPEPSETSEPFPSFPPFRVLAKGSRAVELRATDGVLLEGRVFGGGTTGVVLAHMGAGDQRDWWPVAALLAERGYRVLTFDFRGFCPGGLGGCSRGQPSEAFSHLDVLGAVRFLRSQDGVREVWAGGASQGAIASMAAAEAHPDEIDGLLWVSGVEVGAGFVFSRRDVSRLEMPKLFMVGRDERAEFPESARHFFRWSTPPKKLVELPTSEHGLDMLNRDVVSVSREFRRTIVDFLARHAPIAD